MKLRYLGLVFVLFGAGVIPCLAQNFNRPSIFLDCQTNCHLRYVKEKINFVDYVLDRQNADIYILATSQRASGGTRQVQLLFVGTGDYTSMTDTIEFYWQANVSDALDREILVKNLKKGLLPYLIKAGMLDQLEYTLAQLDIDSSSVPEKDPWNYWSFNIGTQLRLDGEESYSEIDISGRFSAQRVTEAEKITLFSRYNYELSKFTLTDGEVIENIVTRFFVFSEYVKSLNSHWSVGARGDIGSSSFGNTDIEGSFSPAIEYNVYPYSESNTKRLSFLYSIGPDYNNYTNITIFDKLKEVVIRQGINIEYDQTQKWGDISFDARFRQYLHNLKLFSVQFNPNIELNLVKGLRLDIGGYIEYVGDRINIAKSDISDTDILLRTKQLDTSYSFGTYFGINYRFGTRRNNIVNPRF